MFKAVACLTSFVVAMTIAVTLVSTGSSVLTGFNAGILLGAASVGIGFWAAQKETKRCG